MIPQKWAWVWLSQDGFPLQHRASRLWSRVSPCHDYPDPLSSDPVSALHLFWCQFCTLFMFSFRFYSSTLTQHGIAISTNDPSFSLWRDNKSLGPLFSVPHCTSVPSITQSPHREAVYVAAIFLSCRKATKHGYFLICHLGPLFVSLNIFLHSFGVNIWMKLLYYRVNMCCLILHEAANYWLHLIPQAKMCFPSSLLKLEMSTFCSYSKTLSEILSSICEWKFLYL